MPTTARVTMITPQVQQHKSGEDKNIEYCNTGIAATMIDNSSDDNSVHIDGSSRNIAVMSHSNKNGDDPDNGVNSKKNKQKKKKNKHSNNNDNDNNNSNNHNRYYY